MNEITYVGVPFCSTVKFGNVSNVEPLLKLFPNLRTETVAKHHSDFVRFIFRSRRSRQQISASFSNVLSDLKQDNWLEKVKAKLPEIRKK